MLIIRRFQLLFLLAAICGCTAVSVSAQQDVHEVFFDTLKTGDVDPLPVGVDQVKYIGSTYIGPEDSTLMLYVTRVVQRDVDFYADFELVIIDSFYLRTYEIAELDLLGWKRLGATYVVRLEAEFPGSNMRVRWRLFDVNRRNQFANGTVERPKREWRKLAHDISNEVVRELTGEQGPFHTQVVFTRQMGEAKELFISDYDGANEQQLTVTNAINISPSFHPNGREVYFISFLGGDPALYKVDVRSKEISKVVSYPGIMAAPAISPDGNKIACVLSKDGNSEIYVLDMDGRVIKRLTRHGAIDTSPTWSPDGRMICFASDRTGFPQLYMMDSDGLDMRRLTFQGGYNDSPIWSARGDRITFVSRTRSGRFDLASIDTSGIGYRVLTQVGMNENPHFSPDGKHIIFSSTRLGPRDIYTMDITGRNQRRLTRHGDCYNPDWGPFRRQ